MNPFRVWIRPAGDVCQVRVDGRDNADRLLAGLSQSFVFRTFEPITEQNGSEFCSFQLPCHPPLSVSALARLIRAVPDARLMSEPA